MKEDEPIKAKLLYPAEFVWNYGDSDDDDPEDRPPIKPCSFDNLAERRDTFRQFL